MKCKHVFHPVKLECRINIKQGCKNSLFSYIDSLESLNENINCFTGQYISSFERHDNIFNKSNPHLSNYTGLLKHQVTLLSVHLLG